MRRKPCEGRNIEDSEADLYAEYHGNQGDSPYGNIQGQGQINSTALDPIKNLNLEVTPQIRHRRGVEHQERSMEGVEGAREKQAVGSEKGPMKKIDNTDNFPDLKSTIDMNFSQMYRRSPSVEKTVTIKEPCEKSSTNSNSWKSGNSNTGEPSGNFNIRKTTGSPNQVTSDNSNTVQNEVFTKGQISCANPVKTSESDPCFSLGVMKGFDFRQKFGELYADHDQYLREKREHVIHRRSLEELELKNRSKSWSEGKIVILLTRGGVAE